MISSINNPRIKRIAAYSKNAKARDEDGVFVTEGMRMIREIQEPLLREVYLTPDFADKCSEADRLVIDKMRSMEQICVEEVSEDVMKKMADTRTPQGILAVARRPKWKLSDCIRGVPLLLILENIQDPGNLGNMFRTGEGAGVTGIIIGEGSADVYNPKVIRSTMGAVFRMPFLYTDNIPRTVRELGDRYGISTYAAHLKGTKDYDEEDYTRPSAFLIGNEGNGLTREAADAATGYVLIPMLGEVESMNAATSAAILTFEAARQRRKA